MEPALLWNLGGETPPAHRVLWIQRINAATRARGLTYSRFMEGLKSAGIELDRKVLSDIAIHDESAFDDLASQAKAALEKKGSGETETAA